MLLMPFATSGSDPTLPPEGRAGILRGKADASTLAVHVIDTGKGLDVPAEAPQTQEPEQVEEAATAEAIEQAVMYDRPVSLPQEKVASSKEFARAAAICRISRRPATTSITHAYN
jgi:hypothetical protein